MLVQPFQKICCATDLANIDTIGLGHDFNLAIPCHDYEMTSSWLGHKLGLRWQLWLWQDLPYVGHVLAVTLPWLRNDLDMPWTWLGNNIDMSSMTWTKLILARLSLTWSISKFSFWQTRRRRRRRRQIWCFIASSFPRRKWPRQKYWRKLTLSDPLWSILTIKSRGS